MSRRLARQLVVAGALGGIATIAGAQTRRGVIAGTVRDTAGTGIRGVQVEIADTDIRGVTDESGRFLLPGVWPGTVRVRARRLAFAPDSTTVTVPPGDTVQASIRLAILVPTLAATEVSADPSRGKMAPFNERKARGIGGFVTRADIEKRQPSSLSEMLRYLPGVGVTQKMAGEPQPVHMQRSVSTTVTGVCAVQLYVDGHPYPNGNVDDFSPQSVEGVEVYRSAAEIPGSFRTRDATCGVIAIWTRDPESARRSP
jgi:hypothetical protein